MNEVAKQAIWRWTQAFRRHGAPFHRYVSLDIDRCLLYVMTADDIDGSTIDPLSPRFWAGIPPNLQPFVTEEEAREYAFVATTGKMWDIPTGFTCRVLRLYHRSLDGQPYILRDIDVL